MAAQRGLGKVKVDHFMSTQACNVDIQTSIEDWFESCPGASLYVGSGLNCINVGLLPGETTVSFMSPYSDAAVFRCLK